MSGLVDSCAVIDTGGTRESEPSFPGLRQDRDSLEEGRAFDGRQHGIWDCLLFFLNVSRVSSFTHVPTHEE